LFFPLYGTFAQVADLDVAELEYRRWSEVGEQNCF